MSCAARSQPRNTVPLAYVSTVSEEEWCGRDEGEDTVFNLRTVSLWCLQENCSTVCTLGQFIGVQDRIEREVGDDGQLASNTSNWWEGKATGDDIFASEQRERLLVN